MQYNLIYTDDYVFAVDANANIEAGDWYFIPRTNSPHFCNTEEGAKELNLERYIGTRKILAHRPLRESVTYLEGVDVLPDLGVEEDVERMVEEVITSHADFKAEGYSDYQNGRFNGMVEGYNKAREKNRFTEKDMRKAIDMARQKKPYKWNTRSPDYSNSPEKIIEYLSKPKSPTKPIAFECDMRTDWDKRTIIQMISWGDDPKDFEFQPVIKTNTTSEGRTEWIGKYVY